MKSSKSGKNKSYLQLRVKDLLASKWKPFDAVIAITLADKLDTVERLEHLITIAKGRRDATLREIDRRRAAFGQILRDKVREVEDAEFKTVEPKAMTDSRTDGKSSAADRLSTL